ncbi:dual specificity protein phosphatase 7 [Anoplophora glabripennis]|uniref:dual specificity protein phosphatase 7 n=1 Tax=Anoplophora glabripennis TaxID=217634 RepID=UPI000C75B5F4|nr:dual specificity protein phosphatase 7 [Anoplophora glabripennis]
MKRALTTKLALLEEDSDCENAELVDVFYVPPETDEITDEENFDENIIGEEGLQTDNAGTYEIQPSIDSDDDLEDDHCLHLASTIRCIVLFVVADGFPTFRSSFPEWCDSCSELLDTSGGTLTAPTGPDPLPLMGLRSLRISAPPLHRPHRSCDSLSSTANSSTDSSDTDDRCDSSLGLEDDREFPVEILPYLFLGNAANSEDSQALARHSIQYVLNVTPDLPNVFEDLGSIKYMQIPITDHWSQNLASHFPKAIEFIDEARSRQKGVLVHCLAGVSRSVTITVAYLMYKCSLNLNDAFNLVRSRKSNIAPNFHFMEQLHNFERELKLDVSSQSPLPLMEQLRQEQKNRGNKTEQRKPKGPCQNCGLTDDCKCRQHSEFLSPLAQIGVSPDSGIEFDRWASGTPGE